MISEAEAGLCQRQQHRGQGKGDAGGPPGGNAFSNSSVAWCTACRGRSALYPRPPRGIERRPAGVVTEFSLIGNPRGCAIAQSHGGGHHRVDRSGCGGTAADSVKRLSRTSESRRFPVSGVDKKNWRNWPRRCRCGHCQRQPRNNPRLATKDEIIELYHLAYAQ